MNAKEMGRETRAGSIDTEIDEPTDDRDLRAKFETLFQQHNDALLYFVHARVNSMAEAREIVQEAYVRILGLNQKHEVNHLRAYLYKTAGNLATDRLRERQTRERHQHLVLFQETSRDAVSPDRWWEAEEDRILLEQAVAELPDKCRLAFTLVELDEMDTDAVARHMGILPASVRKFVNRAYEHLARRLGRREDKSANEQESRSIPTDRSEQ